MALWFPNLAAQRVLRQKLGRSWRLNRQQQQPLAVSWRDGNTQKIFALDERALALGMRAGLGVADARAMFPALEIVERDAAADRSLLEALADWCDRYTPLVALDGEEGLFLDITGCAHLFGGERAMREQVLSTLFHQGFSVACAIASTPGAAWAMTRHMEAAPMSANGAADEAIAAPGAEGRLLAPLPLHALRLAPALCASLESVGLRSVGAVLATPRAPLARRFGAALILRLDQALGHVQEAITPRLPVPPLSVERGFAEPIVQITDIEALVPVLGAALKRDLEQRGEGARRLDLLLFRVDGHVHRIGIGASRPLREPRLMQRLFREKLAAVGETLDAGFGFDLVRLAACEVAPFENAQANFGDEPDLERADIGTLADRAAARLGRGALSISLPNQSHLPERAVRTRPLTDVLRETPDMLSAPAQTQSMLERPIRLFDPPEAVDVMAAGIPDGPPSRFRWRRIAYSVARSEGPERIAPEWWKEPIEERPPENAPRQAENDNPDLPGDGTSGDEEALPQLALEHLTAVARTRDYFRIEDDSGRRYWIYREGLYEGAKLPRWYMHGLFA